MIDGLSFIKSYALEIKDQYPDYSSLYDHFHDFLQTRYGNSIRTATELFEKTIKVTDIIDSCVDYIENSNADSKSAIKKYLNALSKLYKGKIAEPYRDTLNHSMPFSKLASKVEKIVSKKLKESQSFPPITQEEFENIWRYFKEHTQCRFTQLQTEIIFRLIALYGFKFIKIQNMLKDDFEIDNCRIKIRKTPADDVYVKIPKQLLEQLKIYLLDPKCPTGEFMFTNTKGNPLVAAYLNYPFRQIEKFYGHSQSYCATSLAKYAIIRLMRKNLHPLTIKEISGMEDILINDCARRFLEENSINADISEIEKVDTFVMWDV